MSATVERDPGHLAARRGGVLAGALRQGLRWFSPARLLLALVALAVVFPIVQIALVSTLERREVMSPQASLWPPDLSAYARAWTEVPFPRYFLNSLVVAGLVAAGTTLSSILAAYAFARARFPGRGVAFALVVATLMIPGHMTLIPNYLTFAKLGALDSFTALVLPLLGSGFSVFLLRQYMLGIPVELDEAARLDGAGDWTILWRIVVPLSRPAIVVVALFAFLNAWNDFIWPLLATSSEKMRTVQIGLRYLFREEVEAQSVDWPLVMAGSMIVLAPLLAVYAVAERHLIRGVTLGTYR